MGLFNKATPMMPMSMQQPKALGVDVDQANYGRPIPLVYGTNKVSGNCVWYGDFVAQQVSIGGKGGGGGTTQWDYQASFMLGICEGPIIGFGNVWQGSSFQELAVTNPSFTALGAIGQAPWSHFGGAQALGYSGTVLIAWQNIDLGGSADTPNYQFELNALKCFNFGGGIVDANPSDILNDVCTDTSHGINFPYLGSLTQYSNYCIANGLFLSPVYDTEGPAGALISDLMKWTNSEAYWSEDQLKIVPLGDTAVTGNGVTYTPQLTVQHDFTDSDYVTTPGVAPVEVTRKAASDCLNTVRIEYCDRSYYYYNMIAEARDQEDALTNGVRSLVTQQIHACTQATVARFIAQNMLQRQFYIRNTYKWSASWQWGLLEPTDIVSLTDATLGLNGTLVRITSVGEADNGTLEFEAEELPIGVGHSSAYAAPTNAGATLNVNVDPGPVAVPLIFRMPAFIPGVNQQRPAIGCALAGTTTNWGGAQVFISYDGTTYDYLTTWAKPARYGTLNNTVAIEADPDTTSAPRVTLNGGQLIGTTQAGADNLLTLAMLDSEVISYETATLVSGETYNLGYLRRGCYGTPIAAHSIGGSFVRLDDAILTIPFDPSQAGKTVYLKFLSLNIFSKTPRTLAEETAYSYVIGVPANLPDVPAVPGSFAAAPAPDGVYLSWANANPAAVSVTSIERSPDNATWTVLAQVGNAHNTYHDIWSQADLAAGKTYYYRARALGSLPQAGFSAYTASQSSTASAVTLSAVTGNQRNLIPDSGLKNIKAYWTDGSSGKITVTQDIDGTTNAFTYVGTGAASGFLDQASKIITVTPGTYTLSAKGWISNITLGSIFVGVYNPATTLNYGSLILTNSRASAQVTIPAGVSQVVVLFETNNATVANGQGCGVQDMQFEPGNVMTAYRENTGDNLSGTLLIDFGSSGHIGENLKNVLDDSGSSRYAVAGADLVIGATNRVGLGQRGSAMQLGDARNGRALFTAGVQYYLSGLALSNPAGGTVDCASGTLLMGGSGTGNVAYNSSSVTGLTNGTLYYCYYLDPGFTGGSKTLNATSTKTDLSNSPDTVYLGYITPQSAGGGGGGIGGCVYANAYVLLADGTAKPAGELVQGDIVKAVNDSFQIVNAPVLNVPYQVNEPAVQITTSNGSLIVTDSTPVNCKSGAFPAFDAVGEEIWTSLDGGSFEKVLSANYVGACPAMRVSLGGLSFAGGQLNDGYFIYTHNVSKP